MYFSVFPLLLLFASTICASPVHIGRRADSAISANQKWPLGLKSEKSNSICEKWSELFSAASQKAKRIEGIEGSLKMDFGPDNILLRVNMALTADVEPIKNMIAHLGTGGKPVNWGWTTPTSIPTKIAFVVEMPKEGSEQIIRKYLGTPQDLSESMGKISLTGPEHSK